MTKRFDEKVVIITGAGAGLGRASALQLAKEGAKLSLVDLNEDGLKETHDLVLEVAPDCETLLITADVSKEDEVKSYVDQTVEKFDKIDGFFNNAGVEGKQNLTENYSSDEFKWVLDVNLNGVFYGMHYVLKVMKQQGFGSILNCASVGGTRGVGNQSGYAASKHAVIGLTRNSAIEYGQFNININAIAPGAFMTAMVEGSLRQMGGDNWEEVGKEFVKPNPMKRFGDPKELGHAVSYLLSDEAKFVNAEVLTIDGGQSYKY